MSARVVTCVVLACDECGRVAFTGDDYLDYAGEVHFGDVVEAYRTVREAEWWAEGHRVVCPWCLSRAACDHLGHQWSKWHNAPESGGRARVCGECQTVDYDPPRPQSGVA